MSTSYGGALAAGTGLGRSRRTPVLLVGAGLACIAALALATLPSATKPGSNSLALRHGLQGHLASSLPSTLAPTASASIGASEHSFWPVRRRDSLLTNGGGIHSTFTASGVALRVTQGTLGLSLASTGSGERLEPVTRVVPVGAANQVLYRHGSVREFYRNGPYGLEQGFTLQRRPQTDTGSLVLALRIGGSLIPKQVGSQVLFRTNSGVTALRYGQLSAVDAIGRRLPAHMKLHHGVIQLRIDTHNARYPLRIDPFVQLASKLPLPSASYYHFTISADGNTALVGGGSGTNDEGAAWVFTRSGSTWSQQATLTAAGETEVSFTSVALSADGNTALIGDGYYNKSVGAAWVFTREGSEWTQQAKLTANGETGEEGGFGQNVALSADGNTALVGAPTEVVIGESGGNAKYPETGAAWVFARAGTTWTQQAKLTGADPDGGNIGYAVALSANGNIALVGGQGLEEKTRYVGAVWVFTREGSTWTQQAKLTGGGEIGLGHFGSSVALSSTGSTALIGGDSDNKGVGAAWVFTRNSKSEWTQQGEKLTGSGESGEGFFGVSVALSGEGHTALIGGSGDNASVGAAWVFTRSGSAWTQQGSKITGGGEHEYGNAFGGNLALSADGNTALIGAAGRIWAFVAPGSVPPTVITTAASPLQQTTATLNATVNPMGGLVSACVFEYGTSNSYGLSVPCSALPGSGESPRPVAAQVTGLTNHTAYHFRVVATGPGGTSDGSDAAFTTLPNPPTVVATTASEVRQTTATLNATVNPQGGAVGSISLHGSSINVQSNHEALIRLTCTGTATCSGKVTLTARRGTKKGKKAKSENIGAAAFSIPARRSENIKLRLNGTGRALLSAAHGHLSVTLTILKAFPRPSKTQSQRVYLAQQKASKPSSPPSTPRPGPEPPISLRQGEHAIALWASAAHGTSEVWRLSYGTRCIRERLGKQAVVGCSIAFESSFGKCTLVVVAWFGHPGSHHTAVPVESRFGARQFGPVAVEPVSEQCSNERQVEPGSEDFGSGNTPGPTPYEAEHLTKK